MNGSFEKSYSDCCIFDESHLRYLSGMIQERFKKVSYRIYTIDGANYKLGSLDDILSYGNLDTRRITELDIIGTNNDEDYTSLFSEISVSLYDISEHSVSAYLRLYDQEDNDIVYFSQKMEEFMKSARVSYWWIFNSAGLVLVTAIVALLIFFLLQGALELNDSSALLKIMCGIAFASLIVSIPKVFVKSLFQQGGFLIGLQIKKTKKRIKIRNYILSSILVTLVLGVISGIIVHYLFP